MVAGENCADEAFFVAGGRFAPAVIFRFGNKVLRQIWLQFFVFRSRAGDDFFDEPYLVAFVVNRKVVLVAQFFDARAQDSHAQSVEGAHQHFGGLGFFHHPGQTLAHFVGGFVRERHGQYVCWRDALGQQVGDSASDHARFSSACAGQNEQRAVLG